MKPKDFSRTLAIWSKLDSRQTARLLADPVELRYLEPFIGFERTVSQAAEVIGVPLDRLYFRVRRAHTLGLLQVVKVQRRAGRATKCYTASATGFFIPYHIVSTDDFETLALEFDLRLERLLIRSIISAGHSESSDAEFGLRIFRDPMGRLTIDAAFSADEPYDFLAPSNPATYSVWPELELDFDDAKRLQQELDALWRRYAARTGSQRYLLRLGLAPLIDQTSPLL